MVRLVKLIEQGIKLKQNDFERKTQKKSDAIRVSRTKKDKEPNLFSGKDNYHIRSVDVVYQDLLALANDVLACAKEGRDLDLERVETGIASLAVSFVENTYSGLLLMVYGETSKDYLAQHLVNNTILSMGFGRYLGLSVEQLHLLGKFALFHDVGMVYFEHIYKKQRRLRPYEFKQIQKHPEKSLDFVGAIFSETQDEVLISIHEREAGQGYPLGKTSKEIAPYAKVIAICDVYDALIHRRPFRGGYTPFEAMKIIIRMKDELLDQELVKAFVEYMAIYPVGSLVYLTTGEIAIVVRSNPHTPTKPVVQVLVNPKNVIEQKFRTINLVKNDLIYVRGPLEKNKERELMYMLNMSAEELENHEKNK